MDYRIFNKTQEKISVLGFGTMRLPVIDGDPSNIDESLAIEMIRHAIDSGVNYVDSAYMYHGGNSEIVTGKALKDGYREKVFLADKMPPWFAKSEEDVEKIFNEQMDRLDVECIDFYLVHNITRSIWNVCQKHNVMEFLEEKKAEGKIKHIGFSFHDENDFFKEVIDAYDWDFCQIQLNYMDANFQAGVDGLKYAAARNIPVVVMEPLKGGKLTDNVPKSVQNLWDHAEITRTPAEWAFRWVANFPEVLCVLSGMTNMEQVKENLAIFESAAPNSLTEKEYEMIKKASDIYNGLIKVSCTDCKYCMPCPVKINIPQMLGYYNEWFLYEGNPKVKNDFKTFAHPKYKPSTCTECKACEEACPQHLPIADTMKKVAEIFE